MKFVDLFSSSFTLSVYFLLRWLKISRVSQKFKVKTSMIFGIRTRNLCIMQYFQFHVMIDCVFECCAVHARDCVQLNFEPAFFFWQIKWINRRIWIIAQIQAFRRHSRLTPVKEVWILVLPLSLVVCVCGYVFKWIKQNNLINK